MSNVKVAVRCRPMNSREESMKSSCIISMKKNQTWLTNPNSAGGDDVKKFTFDHSYWSYDKEDSNFTGQEKVFDDLGSEVLTAAYDGYNACVFAYGQTGAGKSYTMMGYGEDVGLIPRICEGLFARAAEESDEDKKFGAVVSYLEIYNERVKDLLSDSHSKNLRVREHPKTGPFVDGLSEHDVTDFSQIEQLMEFGNNNRTTAKTGMNDTSSRSHAVFTILFKQASFVEGIPSEKLSKINLVDLAGSERTSATGATGQRLVEGGNINKSLTTLGLCISALADRSKANASPKKGKKKVFVPYRDSVLTWLLKDSLGGNSKTIMVAAVSPANVNYGETLSTLHYANRAKNIVNKPIVNEDENVRIIRELRAEVERLKSLMGGDEEIAALEAQRKAALERVEAAGTEEEKVQAQQQLEDVDSKIQESQTLEKAAIVKQLAVSEQMMQNLTSQWKGKFDSMHQMLEDRRLAFKEEGRALTVETELPHFVSLNLDDRLETGIVLYYIHEGSTVIGRQDASLPEDEQPDIALSHPDVLPKHCIVEFGGEESTEVTISPCEGAEVWLDGDLLSEPTPLEQGGTIQIGHIMLRFNHPAQAAKLRESGQVQKPGHILHERMRNREKVAELTEKVQQEEVRRMQQAEEAAEMKLKLQSENEEMKRKIEELEAANLKRVEELQLREKEAEEEKEEAHKAYLQEIEQAIKLTEENYERSQREREESEAQHEEEDRLVREKREREARERDIQQRIELKKIQEEKERAVVELRKAQHLEGQVEKKKNSSQQDFYKVWGVKVRDFTRRHDYYVFKVELSLLGERWEILRRYSHFEDLHKLMKLRVGNLAKQIPFPPKHVLTGFLKNRMAKEKMEDFHKKRAHDLEQYLIDLVSKTYKIKGSPFYEVDRSDLERKLAFFRKGGMA
eukprot:m.137305 g.137305  ORF g.137305 m.137305 type:complete len:909 (+) comp11535_c0_seq1:75-2801(+)